MLYALTKALLSGAIIAMSSEAAKRSPALGAVTISLHSSRSSPSYGSGETRQTRKPSPR